MKIKCITHADFEPPGVIEDWAKMNHHHFSICKPYDGDNCLNGDPFDFLIVMGGPQSPLKIVKENSTDPFQPDKYPYLRDEIALIKQAINENKIVLGFCLGAQLIGEALNGKTEKSPEKEIGVFPITLTKEGEQDPLLKGFPKEFPVIHWHNDMPGETEHSHILAYSQGCPRQILKYGKRVYGFQCHMEITLEGIKTLIKACKNELLPSRFIQSEEELLSQNYSTINEQMFVILDRLVGL